MTRREKSRLAREILLTYASTRWYLRRGPLPGVVGRLRMVEEPTAARLPGDATRLGRAVALTLARLPTDSKCLVRSLVLLRLLARRGVESELVIAARPGEADMLDAHAWVEVGGLPVLPAADSRYGRLVTL